MKDIRQIEQEQIRLKQNEVQRSQQNSLKASSISESAEQWQYSNRIKSTCKKYLLFVLLAIIILVFGTLLIKYLNRPVDHNKIDHTISKEIPGVRYSQKEVFIPERKRPVSFNASKIQNATINSLSESEKINESVCFNVEDLLKAAEKQVLAYSTSDRYICSNIKQIYEQFVAEPDNIFYYMTAYNIFLEVCHEENPQLVVNRRNMRKWNSDRTVIEWALKFVQKGDRILLYQQSRYNLIEIILIAKLVGPEGSLIVIGPYSQIKSFHKNMELHQINNIKIETKSVSEESFSNFTKIIGDQKQVPLSSKTIQLVKKSKLSLLSYVNNIESLKRLQKQVSVRLIDADNETCSDPKIISGIKNKGYYFIESNESIQQQASSAIKESENMGLYPFFERYQIAKVDSLGNATLRVKKLQQIKSGCRCIDRSKLNKNENYTVTIYGNYLYKISEKQVQIWESERQPIEWARQKITKNQTIYYQMSYFNLLTIIEIAQIIHEGKLFVYCIDNQCDWIQRQKAFENINNIELVRKITQYMPLTSDAIITDNENIIDKAISKGYLSNGKILGFFTRERQTSFKVFGKLIPTHSLKQIKLAERIEQCFGYSYQNYFWDIDYLNRFYEIEPTLYHIFLYWSGSPYTIPEPRKNSFEQIIVSSKVQVKIFNKALFYTVQGIIPIHEAVQYMSAVHESDYFRIYMMHNFGGGYSDVKHIHYDWRPYFKVLYDTPDKDAMGYYQKYNYYVACNDDLAPPSCGQIFSNFKKAIGNVAYIYKRDTIVTRALITHNHKNLDQKLPIFKTHPAAHARDKKGKNFPGEHFPETLYPLRWAQIGGQIMSRIAFKQADRFMHNLPHGIASGYL